MGTIKQLRGIEASWGVGLLLRVWHTTDFSFARDLSSFRKERRVLFRILFSSRILKKIHFVVKEAHVKRKRVLPNIVVYNVADENFLSKTELVTFSLNQSVV